MAKKKKKVTKKAAAPKKAVNKRKTAKPKRGTAKKAVRKPRKPLPPKGLYLYNKIQSVFAEYNASLPNQKKIPFALRTKIISQDIIKHFMKLPTSKATRKAILDYIILLLEGVNPDLCDARLLPPSIYSIIPYYELDNFIRDVLPNCVDIRVNAGEWGLTPIFNTANYSYSNSGVQQIVENLRPMEKTEPQYPEFNGKVLVKPRRADDNNPSSYFLDMQLYVSGAPVPQRPTDESKEVKKKMKKEEREKEEKMKAVKKLIQEKISKLTKKVPKTKKEEPAKTIPLPPPSKVAKERTSKATEAKLLEQTNLYIANMQRLYNQGLISKAEMKSAMQKALNLQAPPTPAPAPAKKISIAKKATKKAKPKKRKK